MNSSTRFCAATLLLFALSGCGDSVSASHESTRPVNQQRPDLTLIVIDTLRADHLSAYGYPRPTSPTLQALAHSGVRFNDVTAQSSWTQPSMASMLSGRQLLVNAHRLPSSVPSLAERLSAAGYETAAFVANPNLSAAGGYDRGFEHFIGRQDTGGSTWDAPDLEAAVEAWLVEHPAGDAPRFLYLHYLDPHWPYEPAENDPLAGKVQIRGDTEAAWSAARSNPQVDANFDSTRAGMLADIDAYDHEIAVVDRSIARLLNSTERNRERLVVIASDHGEGLWDHPEHPRFVKSPGSLREHFFRDHSYHMWQELLATPLIVSGVGFAASAALDAPVQNVDIMPTLLRAARVTLDPEADGRALQDLVREGSDASATWLLSHSNEATTLRASDNPLKFVFPTDTGFSFGMPLQAYALDTDPEERHNLHDAIKANADHPQRAQLQQLYKAREQLAAKFHLFDDESSSATDEQQRVLEELGYAGRDDAPNPASASPPENR